MPSKYDEQTRAKAVGLVTEHAQDYDSEWASIVAVSGRLGMTAETLRRWVRQAEVDAGSAGGVTSESAREIRELKLRAPNWNARSRSSRRRPASSRESDPRQRWSAGSSEFVKVVEAGGSYPAVS